MKFKNLKADVKVRLGDRNSATWVTARKDEIVDLPEKVGKLHKFQAVEANEVNEVVTEPQEPAKSKVKKSKN